MKRILSNDVSVQLETENRTSLEALFHLVSTYLDSEIPQHSAGDIVASLLGTSSSWENDHDEADTISIAKGTNSDGPVLISHSFSRRLVVTRVSWSCEFR